MVVTTFKLASGDIGYCLPRWQEWFKELVPVYLFELRQRPFTRGNGALGCTQADSRLLYFFIERELFRCNS